jgi:UDP-N-acetylglucosamine 2-epimerase (non-hydrolysing)
VKICFSGQHDFLAKDVFDVFKIAPDHCFDALKTGKGLASLTSQLLNYFDLIFQSEKPDAVLVHGDTATAFAASLAAFYQGLFIAHVEAGLRTGRLREPFPEEFNRLAIDTLSDLCFAPTEFARENLIKEGKNQVFTVGNTVIDALKYTLSDNFFSPLIETAQNRKIVLITAHRRENVDADFHAILQGVADVFLERNDLFGIFPMHPNPCVQRSVKAIFSHIKNIKICQPLRVDEFHNLLAKSFAVITDSGGIQEEAAHLGIPIFLIRKVTERPEITDAGNMLILGTDRHFIRKTLISTLKTPEIMAKISQKSPL